MLNLSNSLSFLRAPLALLFLHESAILRTLAVAFAILTDALDGYLARRQRATTSFGTVLDPAMDKFFVIFALGVLWLEGSLELWQALAMVSRDFALAIFGLYLALSRRWASYSFRAIRWGKVSTACQFFVLLAHCWKVGLPSFVYFFFILLGALALFELIQSLFSKKASSSLRSEQSQE